MTSSEPALPSGTARASGGIGRRAGFRFLCPKGREGSSPSSPTVKLQGDDPVHPESLTPRIAVVGGQIGETPDFFPI